MNEEKLQRSSKFLPGNKIRKKKEFNHLTLDFKENNILCHP